MTCHKICYITDDDQKYDCAAMENGKCVKCIKKCDWQHHKNTPYYIENYVEKEVRTLEELKKNMMIVKVKFLIGKKFLKILKIQFIY